MQTVRDVKRYSSSKHIDKGCAPRLVSIVISIGFVSIFLISMFNNQVYGAVNKFQPMNISDDNISSYIAMVENNIRHADSDSADAVGFALPDVKALDVKGEYRGTMADSAIYILEDDLENVEIKDEPSASGETVGYLQGGDIVLAAPFNDEWSVIEINDITAYVNSGCIKENTTSISPVETIDNGFNLWTNVNTCSGMSADDIDILLADTKMAGYGSVFYENEMNYHINTYFAIAVARTESGIGDSPASDSCNNIFGILNNPDGSIRCFDTKAEGIECFYKLLASYCDVGRTCADTIGEVYCNDSWAEQVSSFMYELSME